MRATLSAAGRWGRRLLAAGAVLVLLAAGTVGALAWLTVPPAREEVRIFGLSAPVRVALDGYGIPHIAAASEEDAARALGYLHARDRLFQMEMMRRVAAGRLAEAIGAAGLPSDRLMRTLGLAHLAEADEAALPPRVRALFEAYAAGVNAWITTHGRYACFECILLPRLEPWTVADSLLWGRYMAWYLGANYRTELARIALARTSRLTPEEIAALWPQNPPPAATDHAEGGGADGPGRLAAALLARLPAFPDPFTLPSEDSNAFAVDAAHSLTGAPLLAGDPHLGFSFPGLWYLVRIDTPAGSLAGASAPGVPLLVLGQNGHIAWSFTSDAADTEDLFEETPVDADHYLGPAGPLAYGRRLERIRVRGGGEEILTVRATRHGPVLSDLVPGESRILALSAAMLSGGAGAAAGLYDLNHARSVEEAGRAAAEIGAPVQNLMVADRTTIALFVTGRVPLRRSAEVFPPQPGADGSHDWTGWREGEALPRFIGSERGFLVNANEEVPAPPPPLGTDWPGPWRAARIAARLAEKDRLGPADLIAIEHDNVSLFARALLPRLAALSPPPGIGAIALGLLSGWDGTMAADRPEPLIFNAWMRALARDALAARGVAFGDPAAPFLEFTASLFTRAGAERWCGGDCTPLLLRALEEATGMLARTLGPDPRRWRWGDLHQALFAHPLFRRIPALARLGSFAIPAPGDDATIDRGAMGPQDFTAIHGPSYRGVYDLAHPDESRFMIAPGESGHPLSPHAADLLRPWRDGEMIPLLREARPEGGEIILLPG